MWGSNASIIRISIVFIECVSHAFEESRFLKLQDFWKFKISHPVKVCVNNKNCKTGCFAFLVIYESLQQNVQSLTQTTSNFLWYGKWRTKIRHLTNFTCHNCDFSPMSPRIDFQINQGNSSSREPYYNL